MGKKLIEGYDKFYLRNDIIIFNKFRTVDGDLYYNLGNCIDLVFFKRISEDTSKTKIHYVLYNEDDFSRLEYLHEFAVILYKVYNRKLIIHITRDQARRLKKLAEKDPNIRNMDAFIFAVDKGFTIKNMNVSYKITTKNEIFKITNKED